MPLFRPTNSIHSSSPLPIFSFPSPRIFLFSLRPRARSAASRVLFRLSTLPIHFRLKQHSFGTLQRSCRERRVDLLRDTLHHASRTLDLAAFSTQYRSVKIIVAVRTMSVTSSRFSEPSSLDLTQPFSIARSLCQLVISRADAISESALPGSGFIARGARERN